MPTTTKYTGVVGQLRRSFRSGKTLSVEWRKQQLRNLLRLFEENQDALTNAIYQDIRRSHAEGFCFEVMFIMNEIKSAIDELDGWMKPTKVRRTVLQILDSAYILKDPLGVVLIVSPWNYPVNLLYCPLVGALAAGNCAVLKPSEIAENTATLTAQLIPKYFDQDVIRVVLGDAIDTAELLKERFDHIFYTGAPRVGRIIMEAASKYLTPVTLELGGKCPVIVDDNCDLRVVGRRIAWGKFMSCGQTCLAPDYVLCSSNIRADLLKSIKNALLEFYGEEPQSAQDYSRIISSRHFDRLIPLLTSSGQIVMGGKHDKKDLYIEPTVLFDVKSTDPIMQEEIFGPILPVLSVGSVKEAVHMVNDGEKPLAVYIFSNKQSNIDYVLTNTSSGGVTVNDVILHMGLMTLPFGGVGESGMGRYHGKYSFDTFTHEKAVLQRSQKGESILWMRYPPYDDQKFFWTKQLTKGRRLPTFFFVKYIPMFLVGLLLGYLLHVRTNKGD